ncbi:MAG: hypothetical protein ABIV63_18445 [Caldimonas sp.]
MAQSSILGGERAPVNSKGRDTDALGPSDSSDSGSDVQGERGFDALDTGEIGGDRADLSSDTDSAGTGERGSAVHDTDIVEGADVAPDRIGRFEKPSKETTDEGLDDPDLVDIDALVADDETDDLDDVVDVGGSVEPDDDDEA